MISLDGVSARAGGDNKGRPPSRLENVSLTWEKGVLAILGTPGDGTSALLEVLAGTLRVRSGTAHVCGKLPADARALVAHAPLEPALPDSLRVEEVCDLAAQIRGEPPQTAASRLDPLGIGKLADRRVRSLSLGEARAVALALALSSRAQVLLLEEPLVGLDPAAPSRVITAIRARASAGATIVVTTASVRDAASLADQLGLLTKGTFTHLPAALAHVGATGAKLRVVVAASAATEVAPFVAALAEEPAVASVETAAYAASRILHAAVAVIVGGPDLLAVARAVAAAAAATNAKIEAIESAVMPLDSIRARIAAPRPGIPLSRPPPPGAVGPLPPPMPPPPRLPSSGSVPPPPVAPAGSVPPPPSGGAA